MRLSNTLNVERSAAGLQVECAACRTKLGRPDHNWKTGAVLQTRPVHELGGPYRTARDLLLRQFVCPECGVLLDTEMALPEDPWIDDRLFASEGT